MSGHRCTSRQPGAHTADRAHRGTARRRHGRTPASDHRERRRSQWDPHSGRAQAHPVQPRAAVHRDSASHGQASEHTVHTHPHGTGECTRASHSPAAAHRRRRSCTSVCCSCLHHMAACVCGGRSGSAVRLWPHRAHTHRDGTVRRSYAVRSLAPAHKPHRNSCRRGACCSARGGALFHSAMGEGGRHGRSQVVVVVGHMGRSIETTGEDALSFHEVQSPLEFKDRRDAFFQGSLSTLTCILSSPCHSF